MKLTALDQVIGTRYFRTSPAKEPNSIDRETFRDKDGPFFSSELFLMTFKDIFCRQIFF
jgi:hypothetical protein